MAVKAGLSNDTSSLFIFERMRDLSLRFAVAQEQVHKPAEYRLTRLIEFFRDPERGWNSYSSFLADQIAVKQYDLMTVSLALGTQGKARRYETTGVDQELNTLLQGVTLETIQKALTVFQKAYPNLSAENIAQRYREMMLDKRMEGIVNAIARITTPKEVLSEIIPAVLTQIDGFPTKDELQTRDDSQMEELYSEAIRNILFVENAALLVLEQLDVIQQKQ